MPAETARFPFRHDGDWTVDGDYVPIAKSEGGGRLRIDRPFPAEVGLA